MLASPGIGSGLDVNGIVSQIMALERRPLSLLDNRENQQKAQLSAFGSIKSALSTFQETLKKLSDPLKLSATTASLADSSLAAVSASSNAVPGSYEIEIKSLAQAHKLKSENFTSNSDIVGSGTLTIQFGTYNGDGSYTANVDKPDQTIAIGTNEATLAGVRSAINNANAGVTASIVNDGSGSRLVIASQDGGTSNALRITVSDDDGNHTDNTGLSRLAFDASTGGVSNLSETMAARSASLVIDGIPITKSTNTITDAIEGVTLNLQKTNEGSTTLLTVAQDTESIKKTVQSFVDGFNALNKTISDLTRFDPDNRQGAALTGDSIARTIQSRMMTVFNTPPSVANGGLNHLSEIGITFQKDGTLQLNDEKLTAVMNDPGKDIASFFSKGTVDFTQTTEAPETGAADSAGFASRLNQLIDGLLRSDGLINGRMDSINTTIRDIGKQRDTVDRRLEDVERRYRAQFAALDTLIASMSSTGNFLQQQLANLPGSGNR